MALQAGLKNEIATIEKDITQPVFGGVLRAQDDTLLTRGQGLGLKLYDEIERDCHAFAVLQKRKMAVVAREWMVDPASQSRLDRKAADLVRAQLLNLATEIPDDEILPQATGFDAACLNLLDAILKGYAVGEVMWTTDGKEIVAGEIRPKDQRRFAFTKGRQGYKLNLLTWQNLFEGEPVPPRKFLVHTFGSKNGSPYGLGLGTRLFWPVFFKRQDITFWLTFVDKFASPTPVGKYPGGDIAPTEKAKLLAALQAIAHDTGVIIPEGMNIDFLEAQRSSSIDSYEKLARYMDEQMSEAVLGETGSTNQSSGGGSRARDQVGNEIRLEMVKADADLLSGMINSTLVRWITALNIPGANPPKVWRDCQEPEDLKARGERDKQIVDMGFKPSLRYIQETYGGEWVESQSPAQPAQPGQLQPGAPASFASCPHCGEVSFARENPGTVEQLAGQLAIVAAPAMDAMVAKCAELVNHAATLEEVRATLAKPPSPADLEPMTKLAGVLAQYLALANLAGRAEVVDEQSAEFASPFEALFHQPFDQAVKALRDKVNIPTARWDDLWQEEHASGFMVAGAIQADLLADLREAVDKAVSEGITLETFRKQFANIVDRYGWSYNGSEAWRSRVIYETNIRTTYQAGRWLQLTDPETLSLYPYLEYRHGDSINPRLQHLAWDGLTLPADDPWWRTHYPPNGWGCKCTVFAAGKRDLARAGKSGPDTAPPTVIDPATGVAEGIDKGWDYNVGMARQKAMEEALTKAVDRLGEGGKPITDLVNKESKRG